MLKVKRKTFYLSLVLVLSFVICGLIIIETQNYKLLLVLSCIIFAGGILYAVKEVYKNIFLIAFLICFFTFLLGGQILNRIMHVYGYSFSDDIEKHTDLVLLLSLIGLLSGYIVAGFIKIKKKSNKCTKQINFNGSYYKNVRTISKYYFIATYLFWILILLDNVFFVLQYGYTSYYLSYSSRVPAILREIGYMAPVALFIYLSTMPSQKEAKIPIIMYLGYLLLSLGTGRRIYFMTGILIVFAYMMLRNVAASEEKPWISKKSLIKTCILMPMLLILMYLFEYFRSEHYVGDASQYSPLVGFFVRQGTSINVIKYTELFSSRLNPDAHYSLYNTLKWIQNNWLSELFNLNLTFAFGRQTQATAMAGTYLADFVSYNANPNIYSLGMGYGSCYIEELYVDFGYLGVFLGNFLYGILLCKLLKVAMNQGHIWMSAIGLYMIDAIFKAPRATFDSFFGSLLYFNSWGPLVIVFLIVTFYNKRRSGLIKYRLLNYVHYGMGGVFKK